MAAVLLPNTSSGNRVEPPLHLDVPGPAHHSRRRLHATLRSHCCDHGIPVLRAARSTAGSGAVLTVVAGVADQGFVKAVLGVAERLGLEIEIVAVVPSTREIPDTVDSMGAIGLARRFRELSGVLPEWDVLHGPRGLARHVERTRPQVVALPHLPHRGRRCATLRTARDLHPAVLIA